MSKNKSGFKQSCSPKGILQFDEEDFVYGKLNKTYYYIDELNRNGVRFVDIDGFDGRITLGENGIPYEVTRDKNTGRREYKMIEVKMENFLPNARGTMSGGENTKYPVIYVSKNKGGKLKRLLLHEELAEHFKPKPLYAICRASKYGGLFDFIVPVDESKLRVMCKDAKGSSVTANDVYWAYQNDIQYDSHHKGRNKKPSDPIETAVFDLKTGECIGIFPSKNALGKHTTNSKGKGSNICKNTSMKRDIIWFIKDGKKIEAYTREVAKLDTDVERRRVDDFRSTHKSCGQLF